MSENEKKTATYVVQECTTLALEPGDDAADWWQDIATVEVPAKSKRQTVIQKALEVAGLDVVPGEETRLRVLDARSAHVSSVSAVAVAPSVVIT